MQSAEHPGTSYVGCDLGVVSAKATVIGDNGLLSSEILPYTGFPQEAAMEVVERAMAGAGIVHSSVARFLSTGFGGKAVPGSDGVVPDTVCLQRAARVLNPNVRMVVNVGGHSLAVFHIDDAGRLGELPVTDVCTAGMGILLEVVSEALELPFDGEGLAGGIAGQGPVHRQPVPHIRGEGSHFSCQRRPRQARCRRRRGFRRSQQDSRLRPAPRRSGARGNCGRRGQEPPGGGDAAEEPRVELRRPQGNRPAARRGLRRRSPGQGRLQPGR